MINLTYLINFFFVILITLLVFFLFLEIVIKSLKFFKNRVFYKNIYRKDFIHSDYHTYLNWIENYEKPMFKYLPIGFRFFNDENYFLKNKAINNSLGFRTHEFSEKKEDELRVILLGGSSAWGCGSSSNETNISGYLEKFINSDKKLLMGKNIAKVFNLAQVNGTLTQDILTLVFYVLNLKPDIVITFTGWNELITNYKMNEKLLEKYGTFYLQEIEDCEPMQIPAVKEKITKRLVKDWFISKSEIAKFFLKNVPNQNTEIVDKISKNINLNSSVVVKNLEIIDKISRGSNFTTYHFLQPHIYRKLDLTEDEKKITELYEKYRPIHGGEKFASFLKKKNIYDKICKDLSNTSTKIKNLIDIFKNEKKSIFYTLVHLNDLGYKIIAQEIYNSLIQKNMRDEK